MEDLESAMDALEFDRPGPHADKNTSNQSGGSWSSCNLENPEICESCQ